jgi:hypothetical protein
MCRTDAEVTTPLLGEQDLLPAALRLCLTDGHLPGVTVDEQRKITDATGEGRRLPAHGRLLRRARDERLSRLALRMRYGAADNHVGTDSYDRWYRLGEPPTYRLAAEMDRWRAEHGQRHTLAWQVPS